ncbi:YndJ family protein [Yinghuangia soli]|uniref:YndJ family protein n=1 Tax=Yinghuangia soli TaxID=2908204 RepID=A0AA41U2W7_9ACTN|nr:YndJ family protein [Yinghuangia soli]MCF2527519.1 YndJ family protein [Yinghuangia soli]
MVPLVNLLVTFGMLVILPAGLRLLPDPGAVALSRVWLLAAVPGAVSLWMPRGPDAAALAALYLAATLALAACAPARLLRTRSLAPRELAILTALASPAVAATAQTAERTGHELFGFDLAILALTEAHFHYTGFAAMLVAALLCTRNAPGHGSFAAVAAVAGTLAVLLGYFAGAWLQLAGAVALTAAMWSLAWTIWHHARPTAATRTARTLLTAAALVPVPSMLLALSWSLGLVSDFPHLSLTWMAATHGVANALGFATCTLLALRTPRPGTPPADTTATAAAKVHHLAA